MKVQAKEETFSNIKIIGSVVGGVLFCALGSILGYLISSKFEKKGLLSAKSLKEFNRKKNQLKSVLEHARENFNLKLHYPHKEDLKTQIHLHNKKQKVATKPTF